MMETPRPFDWAALAQLVMSALGAALFIGGGILMIALAVVSAVTRIGSQEPLIAASLGWSGMLLGALNIPSAVHGFRRLSGRAGSEPASPRFAWLPAILVMLWPLLLVVGQWVASEESINWLLLPPLQLLVIGAPLYWLYRVGSHRLAGNPAGRQWGLVSFGLVATQLITLLVEVILLLGVLLAGLSLFAMQPGGIDALERLTTRLTFAMGSPDSLLRILQGYLNHPLVLFTGITLVAALIPLLEELLKPLGLWFFGGRSLTPAQGFQAGMLVGLTFALAESLGNLANPLGDQWSLVAAGRLGTGVLHVTTSALVGWGLACAWGERRYWRLAGSLLLAVVLHGGWNLFGVLFGLAEIIDPVLPSNGLWVSLGAIAPFAMGILMVTMVFILLGANRRLRQQQPPADLPALEGAQISG